MYKDNLIYIGNAGEKEISIFPKMANRHGLIAGATGTGKTTTVKTVAESFSDAGVPVFIADVKGDLSGIAIPGETEYACAHPTNFWDVYGEMGMPLRTTISEMGPMLLARILGLNQTQSDILTIIFKIADDEQLLLIDTKDLRAMLTYVSENASDYSNEYGNLAKQSITSIIRAVISLESEGGDMFFGEPAINIRDWFKTDCNGKGYIQVLDCQKLILNPTMYSTLLLWMLSEIYETLPEVGDQPKPKMVFFFDEAHMLFDSASKALLDKVEQVVKLIRSKGVGIFFITQSPKDVPNGVLAQLGTKIQHALHAYTPAEQKNVRAAADSFRVNKEFNTYDTLQELQIGEALVSVLDESGIPTIVERTKIILPESSMKPITMDQRDNLVYNGDLYLQYAEAIDRVSAYEVIKEAEEEEKEAAALSGNSDNYPELSQEAIDKKQAQRDYAASHKSGSSTASGKKKTGSSNSSSGTEKKKTNKIVKSVANSAAGTIGREVGNTVGSSIGGKFGKKLGGNVGAAFARGIIGTFCR
ncbi:MAG: DUF853 family protein [Lachnospiraceae bacterium]|nr:DUF853 family protein [Candidatus Colinaster scatohippi]